MIYMYVVAHSATKHNEITLLISLN